jgi:hypothetical protein
MISAARQTTPAATPSTRPATSNTPARLLVACVATRSGLWYAGSEFGFGSSQVPRISAPAAANVSQIAGRHRGDGGCPSGNSSSRRVNKNTQPGTHTQVPSQSTHWPATGACGPASGPRSV